jgi:hypothetical protein
MDNALYQEIHDRVHRSGLAPEVATKVLEACCPNGDGVSAEATAGRPVGDVGLPAAYLHAIDVQAFRGIGERTRLELSPGPGLTVISGRNGSGKSSFAEGLEMLLTGGLSRWEGRTREWKAGWRNLHSDLPVEVAADFLLEGRGMVRLERRVVTAEATSDGTAPTVSRVDGDPGVDGSAPLPSWDELDWGGALRSHRPFLAHRELETLLGSPSALYAVLARVLGLDDLADAADRLRHQRLDRERHRRQVVNDLDDLRPELAGLEDDTRATACLAALQGNRPGTWNLDVVERAVTRATGSEADEGLRDGIALDQNAHPHARIALADCGYTQRVLVSTYDRIQTTDI